MPVCAAITECFPTTTLCAIMHQVIDLRAFLNPGATKTRAINRRVRADFHIVIDLHDADLRNFCVPAFHDLETKSIRRNHHAAVQSHTRTDHAPFANGDVRID